MSGSAYPLKLPNSVKNAAAQLAKADGVSLNQFIAAAVAEKVGSLRAAESFLAEGAGRAKPRDLLRYLRKAPRVAPAPGDEPLARIRSARSRGRQRIERPSESVS